MTDARARLVEHIDAAKKAGAANDLDEARRALERARDVIFPAAPATFTTMPRELFTVAMNLEAFGDLDSARALLAVLAQAVGKQTPDGANVLYEALTRRALLSMREGEYAEAEADCREAMSLAMSVWGDESPLAMEAATGYARALAEQGKYGQALPVMEGVRVVYRKYAGETDENYINTITFLGMVYDQNGEYAEAEALYRENLRISTYRHGVHHPWTAKMLYNLAELARIQGDYAEAEPELARVLALQREVDPDSPALATTQNNYGELLAQLDRHDEALEMVRAALALRESLFGPDSHQVARSLLSIAGIAAQTGLWDEARAALDRCSAIYAKQPMPIGEASEKALRALIDLQCGERDLDSGLPMDEAVESLVAAYGQHPYLNSALRQAADIALRQARWPQAREALVRASAAADKQLMQVLRSSSRRFLESHAAGYSTLQNLSLALVLHAPGATGDDRANAYAIVQRRKGLETRALRLWKPGGEGATLKTPGEKDHSRIAVSKRRRSMLRLLFEGDEAAGPGQSEEDLRRIQREQELWERSRARAAPAARIEEEIGICSAEVARIGTNERTAIIEYSRFTEPIESLTRPGNAPERYVAFVIRDGDEPPQLFDLGAARDIDEAVYELRAAVADRGSTEWLRGARFLYNRLVQPLRESLNGIERMRIAADGALTLLPFELLARSDGALLLDEFRVSYLLFGGESWRLGQFFNLEEPPLVVASPDFGGDPAAAFFPPLDKALAEGVAIAAKLETECRSGADATEALLELARAPEILHIATHGFFFRGAPPGLAPDSYLARRAAFRDPLERCGLAFAGANRFVAAEEPPEEWEDGIVFGAEIAELDLRHTDLAVIAACRSAEGEARAGDVANGLRRALKAAGARTVVCSLWDLPDEITREMMESFYDSLLAGADRLDALHDARLQIRERLPDQPFLWGGMILDGDIGPLRRTQPGGGIRIASISMAGIGGEEKAEPPTAQQIAEEALAEARALAHEDLDASIARFRDVIDMTNVAGDTIHQARYFLAGVLRQSGDESRIRQAFDQYAILLAEEDLAEELRIAARFDRATAHSLLGQLDAALEDIDMLLGSRNLPIDHRAMLLVNRGYVLMRLTTDRLQEAKDHFTAVIEMKGAPRAQRAMALQNRAEVRRLLGDFEGAIADATLMLSFGDQPDHITAGALYSRAVAYARSGDAVQARQDVEELLRLEIGADLRHAAGELMAMLPHSYRASTNHSADGSA